MKFIRKIKGFSYVVGDYRLKFPKKHKLPIYQMQYKNYDKALKSIIYSIEKYSNKGTIIDIGANIGDTAAYIRSFSTSRIICVEGDGLYLKYLKKNMKMLPDILIYPTFLSGRDRIAHYDVVRLGRGTAKLTQSDQDAGSSVINFVSLSEILRDNEILPDSLELIKIDTDGFDFDILLANEPIIKEYKPNLYFEYDINFNERNELDSLEVIKMLESLGYGFVIYDNFGNLMNIVENECEREFIKLNRYITSCRKNGGGIHYCDVFATRNQQIRYGIEENEKQS